jgi:hypothetical protein
MRILLRATVWLLLFILTLFMVGLPFLAFLGASITEPVHRTLRLAFRRSKA